MRRAPAPGGLLLPLLFSLALHCAGVRKLADGIVPHVGLVPEQPPTWPQQIVAESAVNSGLPWGAKLSALSEGVQSFLGQQPPKAEVPRDAGAAQFSEPPLDFLFTGKYDEYTETPPWFGTQVQSRQGALFKTTQVQEIAGQFQKKQIDIYCKDGTCGVFSMTVGPGVEFPVEAQAWAKPSGESWGRLIYSSVIKEEDTGRVEKFEVATRCGKEGSGGDCTREERRVCRMPQSDVLSVFATSEEESVEARELFGTTLEPVSRSGGAPWEPAAPRPKAEAVAHGAAPAPPPPAPIVGGGTENPQNLVKSDRERLEQQEREFKDAFKSDTLREVEEVLDSSLE